MLQKDEIASIVRRLSPQAAVDKLIERVYETGARDNVTISIVQHGERRNAMSRLPLPLILTVLAIIVALGVAFALLSQNRTQQVVAPTPSESVLASAEPSATTTPAAGLATHIEPTNTPRSAAVTTTAENGSSLVVRTATPSAGN